MSKISRRSFAGSLSAGIAGASAASLWSPTARAVERRKYNVLYISADDLGIKLGTYGHPQVISPHLDAFAKESVVFERTYCQIAVCTASRTSILTGIRPETSGLDPLNHDWVAAMPDVVSLPRHFKNNGYITRSVGKIFDPRGGDGDEPWTEISEEWGITETSGALEALRELSAQDEPWFLGIGFEGPHCPWNPSAEALAQYEGTEIELQGTGRDLPPNTDLQNCVGIPKDVISDDEAREATRQYFATVTDLDRMFQEIWDEVQALGLAENTIVIFWSGDHGYHLGDHDSWGKWTCYESSTRIPLMMRVPGVAPARAAGVVESVDMYSTLVDLCDLPPPPQEVEGLSFAPLFDDPKRCWKKGAFSIWKDTLSVKSERYSYMLYEDDTGYRFAELYDLIEDPGELNNLAFDLPDVATEMEELLKAGWQEAGPSADDTECLPTGIVPRTNGSKPENSPTEMSGGAGAPGAESPEAPSSEGGCSCTTTDSRPPGWGVLTSAAALGLTALVRRRGNLAKSEN